MALTADEETRVRTLLARVRSLKPPTRLAQAATDPEVRRVLVAIEAFLTDMASSLRV